jgi:small subunit ribosomal protein S20
MAQHKSAKKRIRRNERAATVNHSRLSRIRTQVKELEAAIASGNKAAAQAAFKKVMPELMRGAAKGVVHKRTVARKLSRISARIKKIAA